MIQNPITFVISNNGTILDAQRGTIRALSNYASKIYVVAPFESVSLKANYLIYESKREVIGQYLAPTTLKGRDVLASTNPQLQTAGDWTVWECSISQRALHRISKYRSGRIGINFEVTEISIPTQAVGDYLGLLKTGSTLPNPATYAGSDGDYYIVDQYNYTDTYYTGTLTKGDYVYFATDAWVKGQNIVQVAMTVTSDLAVDPSLQAELPADISADTELENLIDTLISDVTDLTTDLTAHISDLNDPHDLQANQVTSTDGNVQTDIDNLQASIDDIVDATIPLDYTPSTENYIELSTYIRDAIKELDSNAYLTDQQLASDITEKVTIALSSYLQTLATDDKIYVNDTTTGEAKFIYVSDFVAQVVTDLASFGIVILGEGEYDTENNIPTYSNPLTNKLYLYNNPDTSPNNYDEWLWTGSAWEKLGLFEIDLTNYDTSAEVDAKVDIPLRLQVYPNTKNTSGVAIPKGAVVQFVDSQGDFIEIKEAVASEINANPSLLMGLAREQISHDAFGDVVWFGNVLEVATGSFSLGDILWFDTVNGGLTNVEPSDDKIQIAAVEKASSTPSATNGILLVRIKYVTRQIGDVSGLTTALDGKVDVTGDTMTGNLTIDSANLYVDGNVGIGTTSPQGLLSVVGSTAGLEIGNTATNESRILSYDRVANTERQLETRGSLLRYTTNANERMRITTDGNVGIGTTTPTEKLDVNGIIKGSALHTGDAGDGSTTLGVEALLNDDGSDNRNTAVGYQTLRSNTTGSYNTANGYQALRSNTTGSYNTASGYQALLSNTTGNSNTASGIQAGRFIADGSTGNTTGDYNTFIGTDTKALADNDQNETVIGYNAIGNGSNTVTIGNDNVTDTYLKGDVQTSGSVTGSNITSTTLTLGSFTLEYNEATNSLNFNFNE